MCTRARVRGQFRRLGALGRGLVVGLLAVLPAVAWGQGPALDSLGHDLGSPTAKVEVVVFLDFGCGECARFAEESFGAIDREFVRTGLVRWKVIPFVLGAFRHSAFAAEAAECAAEQGAFLPMHDALLSRRREWMTAGTPGPVLAVIAREVGLDSVLFSRCVRSERMRPRVRAHKAAALAHRIYGTPTFLFQRERRALGALPAATFREVVLEELRGR